MRKWVIVGLVMIIVVAGGIFTLQRSRPAASPAPAPQAPPREAVAVEVAPVTRGSIDRTLSLTGTVVSRQRVELTPKIPGRIASVLVSEGMRVGAGQVVARLESADLAAQVSQAEQGVRQAQAGQSVARAHLRALESGARPQERAQAENAVAQAEANLRSAEAEAARMQQLFAAGAVSRQQLDAAVLQRDVARAQLDTARQQLSLVESGARREDLQMARAQLEQADAAHAGAVAALQMTRVQLAQATIRAPFAGRVAQVPATRGEFVAPGTAIAILYDDRNLEMDAQVGERDIRLVRVGQAVALQADALAGTAITGKVRLVVPAADPVSRAAKIRIALSNPPAGVLPGTSLRADVLVERRTNVLLVNSHAVRQNGQSELIIVKDGRAQVRRVTVGLTHHHIVQITYGVAEGELVVTLGPESLSDGQPVKVVTR
ncbi:MAG TPA: efflux RND transporter periplasmic adaptor subunit [bacterium]|jgi:HlyD family secretion protein|nr:efflux RND transporter periplasmic adaptor subunit [bacterium]